MCPLWPLHLLVLYALMLWPLVLLTCGVAKGVAAQVLPQGLPGGRQGLQGLLGAPAASSCPQTSLYCAPPDGKDHLCVQFDAVYPNGTVADVYERGRLELKMSDWATLRFNVTDLSANEAQGSKLYLEADRDTVADVSPKEVLISTQGLNGPSSWGGSVNVSAYFLGKTQVRLRLGNRFSDCLPVVVTRPKRVIDTVFTASVASLVAIIFVNFGCALDWELVKKTLKRPFGPAIGFTSQYIVLPMISFGLAKLLFPNDVAMQLGMFFTGISPGGGASNIWTYLLGGNLNLSITMTTISTMLAFGMMPFWVFTLGHHIFQQGKMEVPYMRVLEVAFSLLIPIFIGWLIQRYLPRVSKFLVRILKPFSTLLILFIVIFAIITNLYIFDLFSWKIVVAGLGLPWLGYLTGLTLAVIFRQPFPDVTAISVETGVHNTGISIFMLRATLGQPEADLTTVVPVAVAIMTPIPLTIWYVVRQLRSRWTVKKNDMYALNDEERAPVTNNQSDHLSIVTSKGVSNNNHDKY
ncbi:P3 protein [Frankliniella fusca]|uniref:P3 protein n=1 Tax=Frankliniella fusca TaxID=407009 RepID=A0AAE1LT00_9NEOP|nr:P3 protein [Frankliniella fusca]